MIKNKHMIKDNLKVLIIEDDNFLLSMYAAKFEAENFSVYIAEDGEKGIKQVKEKKPDAILLDIIMPGIDGYQVLKTLKEDEDTKDVPVVILTNLNQKDEVRKGLDMGADDYLIKAHFMPSEVVDKIKKLIESK